MTENEVSKIIVDCAFKIHNKVSSGLLESVYEKLLIYELQQKKMQFVAQQPISIQYENLTIENALRIDLLVENSVIVELKSIEQVLPVHKKQLLSYLRLTNKKLGLLINFNEVLIKHGITRIVNNLEEN